VEIDKIDNEDDICSALLSNSNEGTPLGPHDFKVFSAFSSFASKSSLLFMPPDFLALLVKIVFII